MIFSRTFYIGAEHQLVVQIDPSCDRDRFNVFDRRRDLVWISVIGEYKIEHLSTYADDDMRDAVFVQLDDGDAL